MVRPPLTFRTPKRDLLRDHQRAYYKNNRLKWNTYVRMRRKKRRLRSHQRRVRRLFRRVKRLIRFCIKRFPDFPLFVKDVL